MQVELKDLLIHDSLSWGNRPIASFIVNIEGTVVTGEAIEMYHAGSQTYSLRLQFDNKMIRKSPDYQEIRGKISQQIVDRCNESSEGREKLIA